MTVAELAEVVNRLVAEGEGDRQLIYLPEGAGDGPEVWAVLPWTEENDAEPGLLFVAQLWDYDDNERTT